MGAFSRNMQSDPAEIKLAQCCIKLVFSFDLYYDERKHKIKIYAMKYFSPLLTKVAMKYKEIVSKELLDSIREITVSNLDRDPHYSCRGFSWFFSVPTVNIQDFLKTCMMSGFRREVDENCALLCHYATSIPRCLIVQKRVTILTL